jgi:hypothetical protein
MNDTEKVFNPREIPLSRDEGRLLMDGDQYNAVPVARPRVEPPMSHREPTSPLTSAELTVQSEVLASPKETALEVKETKELKDKTVGVLTGQFVQTKSAHISTNPLLLHQCGKKGVKVDGAQWDYQRGAETKGEKLPKAYVRKDTYKASQEVAESLRLELVQMRNTEVCQHVSD